MSTKMSSGFLFAGIVTVTLAAAPLSARMDQGEMPGPQGGMQGMQGMQGMPQNGAMMASTAQVLKNVDQIVNASRPMMRDLAKMHAGMEGHEQHDEMMTSMQGMLDNMTEMQGQLNGMMKDPMVMGNDQAMRGFQQACKSLEQTASSFQSMTKNMSSMMMATMASTKK
jgi:hypothetical protein